MVRRIADEEDAISDNVGKAIPYRDATDDLSQDPSVGEFAFDELVQVIDGEFPAFTRNRPTDAYPNFAISSPLGKTQT